MFKVELTLTKEFTSTSFSELTNMINLLQRLTGIILQFIWQIELRNNNEIHGFVEIPRIIQERRNQTFQKSSRNPFKLLAISAGEPA